MRYKAHLFIRNNAGRNHQAVDSWGCLSKPWSTTGDRCASGGRLAQASELLLLLQKELRAERLRVYQLETRRDGAVISSSRSSLSGVEAGPHRFPDPSSRVGVQDPGRHLPPTPRLSHMRPDVQMLLSPYKSASGRPSSSSYSRPSTSRGGSLSISKLPHAASQEHGQIYASALQKHSTPSSMRSLKRRPQEQGPQTLRDVGQQIIRDHQKRLAEAGSIPSSFPHYSLSSEKKLLTFAAAGGDMTHLSQLLARYKVLSKELANTKFSALRPVENSGVVKSVNWLTPTKSLGAPRGVRRSAGSDRIASCASWPESTLQGPSAGSFQEPGGRNFGLSSVMSMSTSNASDTMHAACQGLHAAPGESAAKSQSKPRTFGLSSLLRGPSSVPKQIGVISSHLEESNVT